jgi:hypothetical protein
MCSIWQLKELQMEMKHDIFYSSSESRIGEIEFFNNSKYNYKDYGYSVMIELPSKIRLYMQEDRQICPRICKISGDAYLGGSQNNKIFGKVVCNEIHTGAIPNSDSAGNIFLEVEKPKLIELEKERNNQKYSLWMNIQLEISLGTKLDRSWKYYQVVSERRPLQFNYALGLEYWIEFINSIELHKYSLIELDFQNILSDKSIAGAINIAIQVLNESGSDKWKIALNKIREVIEHFEDTGVLSKETPKDLNSHDLDKHKRLQYLAWMLKKYCHLGSHKGEEQWTRDDAMLAVNGICLILNAIKNIDNCGRAQA